MLQKNTLKFLKDLKEHNTKEWMDEHRKIYETAKQDYESFVGSLIPILAKYEPAIGDLTPKQCTFRINRDIRFSQDKSPYKTNFGAAFSRQGKKLPDAGYYFHLEPGQSFVGGGIWMPDGPLLKKIRQEIDYNFSEFERIVTAKSFKKMFGEIDGEKLKKAPQGYDESNPAIEYLKLKSFTVGTSIPDKELTSSSLLNTCEKVFGEMKPFIDFLNQVT